MPHLLSTQDTDFTKRFTALLHSKREQSHDVQAQVSAIIERVRKEGDRALRELTLQFDQFEIDDQGLTLSPGAREQASAQVTSEQKEALTLAAERIEAYHQKQLPEDLQFTDASSAELGWQWRPIASVGLYVPGGQAAYPSSVLMNAIPAKVAGVKKLAMSVPMPRGEISPLVVLAADLVGVETIYPLGGAQAIAALAFGTETVAPVDKIVGPGNAYVAAAKREVYGKVGIDMIAGPSEVVIYADDSANPAWLAMDLLAQAEHDSAAQSILISSSPELLARVGAKVEEFLKSLPRREIASASWQDFGALVQAVDDEEAASLINRLAPEHLQLVIPNPEAFLARIDAVGAVFIGALTPEAIGDYVAGSNHVLPTGRTARFASGLNVLDFMTRFSVVKMTEASLNAIGPAGACLADAEGLTAHAASIRLRLADPSSKK